MSIPGSLFPACFNDTTEFVNRPSTSCAGIVTVNDWTQRIYTYAPLESSCNGDLTGLTRCSLCVDAGLKVNSYLVSLHPNSTKCFFFAILFAAAIVNDYGPEDVRTASCIFGLPLSSSANGKGSNNTKRKLLFGMMGGFIGTCFAFILFLVYRKWDKKKKQDLMHESYVHSMKSRVLPNSGAKWFHLAELEQATNGFLQKNMIGKGGFGVVYKGTLSDGTEVAVKQILDLESKWADEFTNEAEIISKIRHINLLALRGFCVTSERFKGKKRYLVYDFMSNGSLENHLFVNDKKQNLSWPQRKNIILDITKGLAYLHYGIKPAIYHRDIKATNILLDSDMKAKVADFGLAKQSSEGQSHLRTSCWHAWISCARILITDWAWELVKSGRVEEVFHESIRNEGPKGVMERFVRVGLLCAYVMAALRPTIADALKMLEGDIDIPPLPDRPLPLTLEMLQMQFKYSSSTSEGSRAKLSISHEI
ncbi:UNVERIFIED_CONTAM: putative receptor-like protein kinase [Sesamum latifolium]|uniref:non-specific serine/threonine protein kinase n=1 Tax=Sesamum latifolium TaxID=2727402 RepID=A0AAW2XAJ3_9LAMI